MNDDMTNQTTPYLREVTEMPEALGNLVAFYREEGWERMESWRVQATATGRVRFSGMGTSYFAPLLIADRLVRMGVDSTYHDAGELTHYPLAGKGVFVLLSQSGESVETRKLAEQCPFEGPLGAIVNNNDSTIARRANWHLPMCAGNETAISTKTYLNTLGVLHLMGQALGGKKDFLTGLERLEKLADELGHTLHSNDAQIEEAAQRLRETQALHFIARGPAMVSAQQAELTFMEGSRMTCKAFTGGAFKHGPYELADEKHRCVLYIPGGKTEALLQATAEDLAGKRSTGIIITDTKLNLKTKSYTVLRVPNHGEDLFPAAASVTQALLLASVAKAKGLTAGQFRNSQKITDTE
jgi:glucosamine--fructose-6-phosphate aminotransferase (isomerizing)